MYIKFYLFVYLCWVFLATGPSLVVVCGGYSSCGVRAPHSGGFCCCGPCLGPSIFRSCGSRAPGHRLSSRGTESSLLCGMWDLPGNRGRTHVTCFGRGILHHWATREVPEVMFSPSALIKIPSVRNYFQKCLQGLHLRKQAGGKKTYKQLLFKKFLLPKFQRRIKFYLFPSQKSCTRQVCGVCCRYACIKIATHTQKQWHF